ncbi:50S ribosomal protein L18 [archaeon]|nr:50S ribosomal protein L18 [archaeon]
MKLSQTYSMKLKRRREGKTDYKKRRALLKSGKPWLVARVKNNIVIAQVVDYEPSGDLIKASASSTELKKYGWKGHTGNRSAGYLTGYLCAKRALENGIKTANLDIGLHSPVSGSGVFSILKGAVDAGLKIPHDSKCFPNEETFDKTIEKIKPKLDSKKVVKCDKEEPNKKEKKEKKKEKKKN